MLDVLTFSMRAIPLRHKSKSGVHVDSGDANVTMLSC